MFRFDVKTQLVLDEIFQFHLVKTKKTSSLVDFDSFIKEGSFIKVYLDKNRVSFHSPSSETVISLDVSVISAEDCIKLKSFNLFDFSAMGGYCFEGKNYVPSWLNRGPSSVDLSNDVYTDFSSLERGDFIIHEDFGVGRYVGLSSLGGDEGMVLSFKNTKINVFPPYFNKVSFYKKKSCLVQEDVVGKGALWGRRVASAKKQALLVAEDLVLSYIDRKGSLSEPCYLDFQIEEEFLSGFPHKDTKDQEIVWGEIKKDLASSIPMDRLICGDVGFGKTELAMRAAFLSAINGLSVVVLAPTTILAKQLFLSFKDRLSSYGVKVGFVSRFVSKKGQTKTQDSFLSGKTDVLIGTHKIVFNKSLLKRASLVIVDDEHKFGVKQKEASKKLNPTVNMLYMSATPIPRTLKMALSKITNISTLSAPPLLKIETKTYVDYFSKKTIQEAVFNEVRRGGQVFFIHNKVQTMPSVVRYLKGLFPSLGVSFLHGQEGASLIEKKMDLFLDKKIDVLVASSIVESGVDIPSVNTIIINNAHLLGVSQLYQMRGRVGRSSKSSFAYLLVPKGVVFSINSLARLKVIEKNSSLGSCYAVSLEDLELRGGGSVFGYKQSGSSGRVGFELYNRFLEEAVNKIERKHVVVCSIGSFFSARIPETYLPSSRLRVWLYKELSSIGSVFAVDSFKEKICGLFGPPPPPLERLLLLKRLELLGGLCFFSKITLNKGSVILYLDSFFWKKKIESLINALIGYKFVLVDGGSVLKVDLSYQKTAALLNTIYKKIKDE